MQIVALRSSCAGLVRPQRASLTKRSNALQSVGPVPRARTVTVYATERNTWYPGATPPSYLDGSLAGDYGFDPLRLGANPDSLKWYKEAELTNGRWAMMAVVGILFTDLIGKPSFWEAGAKVDLPFGGLVPLALIELAVFAVVEYFRFENWKKVGASGFLFIAPFDPLGMNSKEMQIKEVKNGRLAMLAFLGFCSQAAVRGLGPVDSLKLHIDNPGYNNIFTSAVGGEATIAVIALSILPITLQARKALGGTEEDFRPIPGPW